MQKAGYRPNGIHDSKIKDLKLTRYQSARYNMRYREYQRYLEDGRPAVRVQSRLRNVGSDHSIEDESERAQSIKAQA